MKDGIDRASRRPQAVFLFDLIQDINVLRPIIRTLATKTRLDLLFLVSNKLIQRDRTGVWLAELKELAHFARARIAQFDSPLTAYGEMQGHSGILFSASETDLPAHQVNHDVFRQAPKDYVRITIQHGHECVGFRQNIEQTLYHGEEIRFAADILCGWGPIEAMPHLCDSERSKYFELGPPAVLDKLFNEPKTRNAPTTGLICENMHSVRMRTTGDFGTDYLTVIKSFAASQARRGRSLALRPHPGGQFIIKQKIALPTNVHLANAAMYKTDLTQFAYGISAPSSVLIDMVMAGIPTAVWSDEGGVIDTSGYAGLTKVSSLEDWEAFAEAAIQNPEPILAQQRNFLRDNALDVDPEVICQRLLSLVEGITGATHDARPLLRTPGLLLIVNGVMPTLHISFLKPLEPLVQSDDLEISIITEGSVRSDQTLDKIVTEIDAFQPDIAVFCRYSGPAAEQLITYLQKRGVPVIYHIDDDLLNVPAEIGSKSVEHNRIERTSAVRHLLGQADLVYCSTPRLRAHFELQGLSTRLDHGAIYCSGTVIKKAQLKPVKTIGFMGNDKTPELIDLVSVISQILERNTDIRFELFGSMDMPTELLRFGDRVQAIERLTDYNAFVARFQQLDWDIGLAPLRRTPFNVVKADTKWVDYTSIGAAVIASRDTAYDACCADGCGVLAQTSDEWGAALQSLIDDADKRFALVAAAQAKVEASYSPNQLARQVLEKFDKAAKYRRSQSQVASSNVFEPV